MEKFSSISEFLLDNLKYENITIEKAIIKYLITLKQTFYFMWCLSFGFYLIRLFFV